MSVEHKNIGVKRKVAIVKEPGQSFRHDNSIISNTKDNWDHSLDSKNQDYKRSSFDHSLIKNNQMRSSEHHSTILNTSLDKPLIVEKA